MASSAFGWAWLPSELLDLILDRLLEFTDYVRFCSVCKPWRLIALGEDESDNSGYHQLHKQRHCILKSCRNKLPMLVIPTKHNTDDLRSFYSILDGKLHDLPLPLPCETRFFGSSHGWLFTIDKSFVITLINPWSGKTILLPEFKDPWEKYRDWLDVYDKFPGKAILSSDPCMNPCGYEIVIIYLGSMELAVFRSGDNAWTFLTQKKDYFFCDVVYYKGLFHAVNHLGEMVCVEDGTDRVVVEPTLSPRDISTIHLVESIQGDLLMVQRFTELNENQEPADVFKCKTVDFKVFKLLRSDDQARLTWVQIESIGDQALFLGDNHAVCVSTSEFSGCKPNSIYYTEHYFDEFGYVPCGTDDDNGVFDLGNRRLELHYVPDPSHKPLLPAIWIVPNLITS
ncbi:hypothetical protein RJ640_023083 [Escallonia rubra]|uniref:Uncharacterized protein n=1 Tax=Escallonia rubra TaxID=112253 RepID=A0AA88UG12_9ASTE|nr:hypothetical protein RJ640_023083 [Escallonia rubra]